MIADFAFVKSYIHIDSWMMISQAHPTSSTIPCHLLSRRRKNTGQCHCHNDIYDGNYNNFNFDDDHFDNHNTPNYYHCPFDNYYAYYNDLDEAWSGEGCDHPPASQQQCCRSFPRSNWGRLKRGLWYSSSQAVLRIREDCQRHSVVLRPIPMAGNNRQFDHKQKSTGGWA